jgi:RES domain-containing protein
MLTIAWQRAPLLSGSHLRGGRLNAAGTPALYLASTHRTAISEFHQGLVRPGTLAGYDVVSTAIADLLDDDMLAAAGVASHDLYGDWRAQRDAGISAPRGWELAARLIAAGADGALYRSVLTGEANLVLWRWHRADTAGEGAAVKLVDPGGDLAPRV